MRVTLTDETNDDGTVVTVEADGEVVIDAVVSDRLLEELGDALLGQL